jgi:hypothetical protein
MFTELENAFDAIAETMKHAARDCSASPAPRGTSQAHNGFPVSSLNIAASRFPPTERTACGGRCGAQRTAC